MSSTTTAEVGDGKALDEVRRALDGYASYPVYEDTDDPDELERREQEFYDHLLDVEQRLERIARTLGVSAAPHIYRT